MKKLLILMSLFTVFACSEPESSSEDRAEFRAAQLALDLQQLGASIASGNGVKDGQITLLNSIIDTYSQDFSSQHDRAISDFIPAALDSATFDNLSKGLESKFQKLQSILTSSSVLGSKQIEAMYSSVPSAVQEMVFPLLETTRKLYTFVEGDSGVKNLFTKLELHVRQIRKQSEILPENIANQTLILADVAEAVIWAAEPAYTASSFARQASLLSQGDLEILTRGSSDGSASPVKSVFYAIIKRIPNALLGAIQGVLTAVDEGKSSSDTLTHSLIGAARGFMKTPDKPDSGSSSEAVPTA